MTFGGCSFLLNSQEIKKEEKKRTIRNLLKYFACDIELFNNDLFKFS